MAYNNYGRINDRTITIDTDKLYNDLDMLKQIQGRIRDGLPETRRYVDTAVMAVENVGTRCTGFREYLNNKYQYDKIIKDMEKMLEDADGSTERWQKYTDDWVALDQNLGAQAAQYDLGKSMPSAIDPSRYNFNTPSYEFPIGEIPTYPQDDYTYTPTDVPTREYPTLPTIQGRETDIGPNPETHFPPYYPYTDNFVPDGNPDGYPPGWPNAVPSNYNPDQYIRPITSSSALSTGSVGIPTTFSPPSGTNGNYQNPNGYPGINGSTFSIGGYGPGVNGNGNEFDSKYTSSSALGTISPTASIGSGFNFKEGEYNKVTAGSGSSRLGNN